VLSGRGLYDGLITRLEESYRLWCVFECDLETSSTRRPWPTGGCRAKKEEEEEICIGVGRLVDRRVCSRLGTPLSCPPDRMWSIAYCIYNCLPEDKKKRFETCRKQQTLTIKILI